VRSTDGKVVFEGSVRPLENGFPKLWLPRDLNLTVRLEAKGQDGQRHDFHFFLERHLRDDTAFAVGVPCGVTQW
jgi:hypothetical protein